VARNTHYNESNKEVASPVQLPPDGLATSLFVCAERLTRAADCHLGRRPVAVVRWPTGRLRDWAARPQSSLGPHRRLRKVNPRRSRDRSNDCRVPTAVVGCFGECPHRAGPAGEEHDWCDEWTKARFRFW